MVLVDADQQKTSSTWAELARELELQAPTTVGVLSRLDRPEQVPRLAESADWVVIDCPPRSDELMRSALAIADLALLPCGPSTPDVWALAESVELVQRAQELRGGALKSCVVINRQQPRTALSEHTRAAIMALGMPVLATEVRLRVAYGEAWTQGVGVVNYGARSKAAEEILAVVAEIEALLAPKPPSKKKKKKGKHGY